MNLYPPSINREDLEVDAKEFLELYMDKIYSRETIYKINEEKRKREKMESEYEDKLQKLENRFENLRKTIKDYKKIMNEKGIKYN
jgi:hypothetical protein